MTECFLTRMLSTGLPHCHSQHVALAEELGALLLKDGRFELPVPATLGLVCFRLKVRTLHSTSLPVMCEPVLLRLSFLFKNCGQWTLSCDFVPHNYETLKWLSSLSTLMQESFWWWQCCDWYIISSPPPYALAPLLPVPNNPHGFCGC